MESEHNKKEETKNEPADFEKAISATGFGLFNFILLLITIPSCFSTVFETTTMSYVLPSAECDLKLSLLDKGILNAITYAGMISSAIVWGFVADTQGRKKLLVYGFLADSLCAFGGSLSQNTITLMVFKYLGGVSVCGPFAVLMSYLTEFHGTNHRPRIMMIIGTMFSTATLVLSGLAWAILPLPIEFYVIPEHLVVHSWQVFIAICALPSLISGITIMFLPESPKFLMSQGRNEEALEVFKTVFAINMHLPRDKYPITELLEEVPQRQDTIYTIESKIVNGDMPEPVKRTALTSFREGLIQLKPMFQKPYLGYSLHVYATQFCILMGLNTIRLWLPQLFASIAHFEETYKNSTEPSNLCVMLEYSVRKTQMNTEVLRPEDCEINISSGMYVNTIIVGVSGLVGYFVAGSLINALGNKWIMSIALTTSGVCGLSMYWASNSMATLILSSIYVTVASIGSTSLMGVIVNLFPTSLRTMLVSVTMMFGRFGALIGNILFPYFLELGCIPPFLLIGCILLVASILGSLLPSTHKTALK